MHKAVFNVGHYRLTNVPKGHIQTHTDRVVTLVEWMEHYGLQFYHTQRLKGNRIRDVISISVLL